MGRRLVLVVGYDDAELLDIACVTTALAMANELGALADRYRVRVAAPGGGPVTCASGLTLLGQVALERAAGPLDTLIVSGGLGHLRAAADLRLVGHVRRLARESRRVASLCTGASVLAAAGLLDGRRATTHWRYAAGLAASYPQVTVDADPIYIRDGDVATAAGVTSALDLTLAFVAEDHGFELSQEVARHMVTYLHRPGNQAQMSIHTAAPVPRNDLVRRVVERVIGDPGGDLSPAALAAGVGVSERHLHRLFLTHLGHPPARYVRRARAEAAAKLLVGTSLPVARIALRCGLGTAETLRRVFVERYGISPARYRAMQTG
ncbi:GlxA family transcriptional regulator [Micromonospora zhanjiangensis]|uniref:GlxA family transcriptional regulator n=1 Tax=Micromonospora zhanjiangensis TaxID=1522057 RepID=A0ABV8KTY7_9ACTN